MTNNHSSNFPISTLLREAKRLHAALIDDTTGPAVARRLAKKNPSPVNRISSFHPASTPRSSSPKTAASPKAEPSAKLAR